MILSYGLHDFMTFGRWLKEKRAELRISGAELERLSGVSRQYISNLERELVYDKTQKPVQPSVEIVEKIANALKVPVNEARLAAGYAPIAEDAVTLDISPDLRVALLKRDVSPEDRARLELALKMAYETAKAIIEHETPTKEP